MKDIAVVDHETRSIQRRPVYPPEPVGTAIRVGGVSKYLAWGHPTGNNSSKQEAYDFLCRVREHHRVVYHNSKFDMEVEQAHFDLPVLSPDKYEDTLFTSYLVDPRAQTLALKELCETRLGIAPEERDELKEWILSNVTAARRKPSSWGAYICEAPAGLAGRYAVGDVDRTEALFLDTHAEVTDADMETAYLREKRLMPVVLGMEQRGIRCNVRKLRKDLKTWMSRRDELEQKIFKRLGGKEFNLGSGPQLADALDRANKVDQWFATKKGGISTSRDNLERGINDPTLLTLLSTHSKFCTYINTFGLPWLAQAEANNGYLYPSFNQVRSSNEYGGSGGVGARTGRFSSSGPNFQNVPGNIEDDSPYYGILPSLRDYLIPDEGCVFIGRDYSQQEVRILAHYEDGGLLVAYRQDPRMDVHEFARKLILERTGVDYPRKFIKVTAFGIIYGMGIIKIQLKLNIELADDARALKDAYLTAIPGIRALNLELKRMVRNDEPLYTWGGRRYYCEPPRRVDGQMKSFEYKMLNLLIQGSAADCTKEGMIRADEEFVTGYLTLQVHDELLGQCPKGDEKREMAILRECMESVEFDVPMLSDGKYSARSWGAMKSWESPTRGVTRYGKVQ